jgi:hypothetical protein
MTLLAAKMQEAVAKAATKPQLYKIESKKDTRRADALRGGYLKNPGGFDVYVNGKQWGRTSMESRGPRGTIHYVCQLRGLPNLTHTPRAFVSRPRENPRFGNRTEYFTAASDKIYLRNLKPGEAPVPL